MSNELHPESASRGARSAPPPYRETVYHPIWLTFPPVLTAVLYFALRGAFEAGTPTPFWTWDVVWFVTILGIMLIPIFLGRFVVLVERGEFIIRFGFFSGGEKKIPLELIE